MTACDNGSADTFCTTSGNSPPILDAGLDYIERRGWPVLPLYPRQKNPYQPAGYKELPPLTPDELRRYFDETPDLNIGMHTGHGIIVIDVDEKPGKMSGSKALAALEDLHGKLPKTLTNLTGGGGRQLFFYLPPGYGPFGDRLPAVTEWLRSHPEAEPAGVIDIRTTDWSSSRRASTQTVLGTAGKTRTCPSLPCRSPGAGGPSHSPSMTPSGHARPRAGKHLA